MSQRGSPPLDFPSSDMEDTDMQDAAQVEQSMVEAPPPQPLFFPSTPSAAGTPARRSNASVAGTPGDFANIMARRAVGLSTPRRKGTPLFERELNAL